MSVKNIAIVTALCSAFLFAFHWILKPVIHHDTEKISILLNIIFAASFISIFFFTVGAEIEHKIVEEQVDRVVKDLLSGAKIILPPNTAKQMSDDFSKVKLPDLSEADKAVDTSNQKLFNTAITTISIFVATSVIYIIAMSYFKNISLVELLKILGENSIILVFIGLTEYIFLSIIAVHFRSADPNKVKLAVVKSLQNLKPDSNISVPDSLNTTLKSFQ